MPLGMYVYNQYVPLQGHRANGSCSTSSEYFLVLGVCKASQRTLSMAFDGETTVVCFFSRVFGQRKTPLTIYTYTYLVYTRIYTYVPGTGVYIIHGWGIAVALGKS